MKRAVLIVFAFLPLALAAQEKDSSLLENQMEVARSLQANASSISRYDSWTQPETGPNTGSVSE